MLPTLLSCYLVMHTVFGMQKLDTIFNYENWRWSMNYHGIYFNTHYAANYCRLVHVQEGWSTVIGLYCLGSPMLALQWYHTSSGSWRVLKTTSNVIGRDVTSIKDTSTSTSTSTTSLVMGDSEIDPHQWPPFNNRS